MFGYNPYQFYLSPYSDPFSSYSSYPSSGYPQRTRRSPSSSAYDQREAYLRALAEQEQQQRERERQRAYSHPTRAAPMPYFAQYDPEEDEDIYGYGPGSRFGGRGGYGSGRDARQEALLRERERELALERERELELERRRRAAAAAVLREEEEKRARLAAIKQAEEEERRARILQRQREEEDERIRMLEQMGILPGRGRRTEPAWNNANRTSSRSIPRTQTQSNVRNQSTSRPRGPPSPSTLRPSQSATAPTAPQPSSPKSSATPATPPPQSRPAPTEQEHHAATKIQALYRRHRALRTVRSIQSSFETSKAAFVRPAVLDFVQPSASGSGIAADAPVVSLPTSTFNDQPRTLSEEEEESKRITDAKLAYTPTNAPLHAYTESLIQLLNKLDAVESGGDRKVRESRREVVRMIEREAEEVEGWWRSVWRGYIEAKENVEEKEGKEKEAEGKIEEEEANDVDEEQQDEEKEVKMSVEWKRNEGTNEEREKQEQSEELVDEGFAEGKVAGEMDVDGGDGGDTQETSTLEVVEPTSTLDADSTMPVDTPSTAAPAYTSTKTPNDIPVTTSSISAIDTTPATPMSVDSDTPSTPTAPIEVDTPTTPTAPIEVDTVPTPTAPIDGDGDVTIDTAPASPDLSRAATIDSASTLDPDDLDLDDGSTTPIEEYATPSADIDDEHDWVDDITPPAEPEHGGADDDPLATSSHSPSSPPSPSQSLTRTKKARPAERNGVAVKKEKVYGHGHVHGLGLGLGHRTLRAEVRGRELMNLKSPRLGASSGSRSRSAGRVGRGRRSRSARNVRRASEGGEMNRGADSNVETEEGVKVESGDRDGEEKSGEGLDV